MKSSKWLLLAFGSSFLMVLTLGLYFSSTSEEKESQAYIQTAEKFRKDIAHSLRPALQMNQFPDQIELDQRRVKVEYTIKSELQERADRLLKSYRPDYGAVVMMDADTGKILALSSYQRAGNLNENMALKGSYPAASIFKIVTASAAVDKYHLPADTLVYYNGGNHTLYKKNVMSNTVNRWTRSVTLREAFARSINSAFGRLTFEKLQPADIQEYAHRFGFNQEIPSDLPFEAGYASIPNEKNFELAEVVSGYNKMNTMSPVHGAVISAAIANDGRLPVPYIVERLRDEKDRTIFESQPITAATVLSPEGATKLKRLMRATVTSGTSRKSFRTLLKSRDFREIEFGGKTGSLTGNNPRGKTDWFVGYAIDGEERIAIAALTVNVKTWTVKSSHLAQDLFRTYFKLLPDFQISKNRQKTKVASTGQ